MKITTLRFPEQLHKNLQDEAKTKNISLNKLVTNKLKNYPEMRSILDKVDYLQVCLEEHIGGKK